MPPLQKSFLQEFALKEISDVSGQINLEIRKGALSKTRTFQSGVDFMSMSSMTESLSAPVVFAGYGVTEKEIGYAVFMSLGKGSLDILHLRHNRRLPSDQRRRG